MSPKVTIIIPNYNHAAFLPQRLNSVFNQTCQAYEIILLDDASTDNSRDILESYRSHPKVKAIHYNTHNSGSPFKQWEKGIGLADSEWIWIAESDDYCTPNFLEALLPALQRPDCVLAYNEITWINTEDQFIKQGRQQSAQWYEGSTFLANNMMLQNVLVNAGMLIFRRSALAGIGTRWTQMKQAGDYLLWVQIAAKGTVYASGQVQASFVRHPQSLSLQQLGTPLHLAESLEVQDWMVQHGGVPKNLHKKYFEQQLLQMLTSAKQWPLDKYQQHYAFWHQQAAKRGIQLPNWRLKYKACIAKLRHYYKQHKLLWQ